MKLFAVWVWIEELGADCYWVDANSPEEAATAADKRIREETDATKWEIKDITEVKGR